MVFENRMTRKIYGSKREEDGSRRKSHKKIIIIIMNFIAYILHLIL
jgi:hypothetical protein